jgi:Spy/CpxP family protein refolding chaperone
MNPVSITAGRLMRDRRRRNMNKKITVFLMVFVLMVAFNVSLLSRNWDGHRQMAYGIHLAEKNLFPVQMLLKFKVEIGLSDEQVGKIEKMQLKHQESMIKQSSDIRLLELKIGNALKAEPVDRAAVEKMIREVGNMKTNLSVKRINFLLDVKNILTTDQLNRIEKMKNEMRLKRYGQRDRRRPK